MRTKPSFTVEDAKNGVDEVLRNITEATSCEDTHRAEDELLEQFVRMCAEGKSDPSNVRKTARELVRLLDAERTRWFA